MNTLKFLRKRQGYSQSDIAEKLGIDQSCYCRKERGLTVFTVEEAKKLSLILGYTIDEIFFDN